MVSVGGSKLIDFHLTSTLFGSFGVFKPQKRKIKLQERCYISLYSIFFQSIVEVRWKSISLLPLSEKPLYTIYTNDLVEVEIKFNTN